MELIAPEGLAIAEAYLTNRHDIIATAEALNLPVQQVEKLLAKKETQRYIDKVFNESGFRNRHRMGQVWDEIIAQKLEELDDSGMGSSKDIVEIMEKAHKFSMEQMKMQMELVKLEQGPTPQTAIQVNNNYNTLLSKIIDAS